jgi:hypothetical protein
VHSTAVYRIRSIQSDFFFTHKIGFDMGMPFVLFFFPFRPGRTVIFLFTPTDTYLFICCLQWADGYSSRRRKKKSRRSFGGLFVLYMYELLKDR